MVGLKFLFARLAWKESFPQGVSASNLLFCSEENSLYRSEPACPRFWPQRPRGDQSTAQEAGPGGAGGEGCLLTFLMLAPRVAPSIFAVPSLVDVGLCGSVCARRGLVRAACTPKRVERLASPAAPSASLGGEPPHVPADRPRGSSVLPCSPPADLRGDTGHPTVAGRASWLLQPV